jgi:hypothetical protein
MNCEQICWLVAFIIPVSILVREVYLYRLYLKARDLLLLHEWENSRRIHMIIEEELKRKL